MKTTDKTNLRALIKKTEIGYQGFVAVYSPIKHFLYYIDSKVVRPNALSAFGDAKQMMHHLLREEG